MIKAEGVVAQTDKFQHVVSGVVDLHMKGVSLGESFVISKNWLVLGSGVSLQSARPQMAEHQEYKKIRKYSQPKASLCLLPVGKGSLS